MPTTMENMIVLMVIFFACFDGTLSYSKYGRTCKDIGCPSNEICVMAEDPCHSYSRGQCGRYPTCSKAGLGEQTCRSLICPTGQYCKTVNGKPTCVGSPHNLAPAARRPQGYSRPTGIVTRPSTPPSSPPRSPSNSYPGYPGNSIGNGSGKKKDSLWSRIFGGGGSRSNTDRGGSGRNSDYRKPSSTSGGSYYSGGKDYHNTHVSTDSQGNKTWRFSRNRRNTRRSH